MLTREALRLSPHKRRRLLEKAGLDAARDWILWLARREQLKPRDSWLLWLICSGRGWGKTRTAAECIRQWVEESFVGYFALIGPTKRQTRDVMIEGESGILSVVSALPDKYRPKYEPSNCQIKFHNGAIAYICSADQPDRLRGLEFEKGWFDEISTWRPGLEAWNNAMMGLRVGERQQIIATMTPRPNTLTAALLKGELVSPDRMVITRGGSYWRHELHAPRPALGPGITRCHALTACIEELSGHASMSPLGREGLKTTDLSELKAASDRLAEAPSDVDEEKLVSKFMQLRRRAKTQPSK